MDDEVIVCLKIMALMTEKEKVRGRESITTVIALKKPF